ncbi:MULTISPECIES: 5-carboxymethyl-2-hydroxymuconate Delta-isomerase [Vitreoscilla]|uniref:5-carboxymethyl-2-hydroxymuconate isomerase n=1 Tax=Vitreoscilla stercoraria TaxID=61 RepID=A0ABY4E9Z3_VITST|nr:MULTISPECIES: hypothetical protein [Vitreoscilla]AUZ05011.1 hypothetical protein ADP71_14030 [Vitreoscilla sp. C1]UOO91353.1 hypothetical protein LVJ81_06645 [Vitreoscilla stercoraria]
MPHLILSVSAPLAEHKIHLLKTAHQAMLSTQIAPALDVKSRVMVWDDFMVGQGSDDAFVHVEIRLLQKPERTNEVQKALSDAVIQALQQVILAKDRAVQVSCEIVLMNAAVYGKVKIEAFQ